MTVEPENADDASVEQFANRMGCLLQIVLWSAIFALILWPEAWGPKPTWAKWIVLGYAGLMVLGLLHGLIFGEIGERVFSFIVLTMLGIVVVLIRV